MTPLRLLRAAHSRNRYPLIRISGSLRFPVMLIKGAKNKAMNSLMCKHIAGFIASSGITTW